VEAAASSPPAAPQARRPQPCIGASRSPRDRAARLCSLGPLPLPGRVSPNRESATDGSSNARPSAPAMNIASKATHLDLCICSRALRTDTYPCASARRTAAHRPQEGACAHPASNSALTIRRHSDNRPATLGVSPHGPENTRAHSAAGARGSRRACGPAGSTLRLKSRGALGVWLWRGWGACRKPRAGARELAAPPVLNIVDLSPSVLSRGRASPSVHGRGQAPCACKRSCAAAKAPATAPTRGDSKVAGCGGGGVGGGGGHDTAALPGALRKEKFCSASEEELCPLARVESCSPKTGEMCFPSGAELWFPPRAAIIR
jgi:hypothetical protein